MGHASPDITLKVYGHLINKGRDDAAEKLDALMLGMSCNNGVTPHPIPFVLLTNQALSV